MIGKFIVNVTDLPKHLPEDETINEQNYKVQASTDLYHLGSMVETLHIASHTCNESFFFKMTLEELDNLKEICIGDHCFERVIKCVITNNPVLQSITIGSHSFTSQKSHMTSNYGTLEICDNPSLDSLQIGNASFMCYDEFTVTSRTSAW